MAVVYLLVHEMFLLNQHNLLFKTYWFWMHVLITNVAYQVAYKTYVCPVSRISSFSFLSFAPARDGCFFGPMSGKSINNG